MAIEESNCSPYIALTEGKSFEELAPFLERFSNLSDDARNVIASPETAKKIFALVSEGVVGEEYAVAVAKTVAFLVMGDVTSEQLPGLLAKLGILNGDALAKEIVGIATPPPAPVAPPILKSVPPLTVQRPLAPMGSNAAPRNIIDLRKPPQAT